MFKKQKAFTLSETIVVVIVIGVLAILTVCNTLSSQEMQQKKLKGLSKAFYSEIEYAYLNIITNETVGMNITKIDNEEYNTVNDSFKLEELFENYMEISEVSCNELPSHEFVEAHRSSGELACAHSNRGLYMGFHLDRECDNAYQVKEYMQDDVNRLNGVEDACGYIAYAPKDSRGRRGIDFFTVALGKRSVK